MIYARARHEDLNEIVALEQAGFASGWSEDAWRSELDADDRYVLVARELASESVVGVATFQHVADTADLHRVAVAPNARRQGIGRGLLLAGVEWATASGASRMLLEVEADNDAALALYRGLGFAPIARRVDYYGPDRHALVMERGLGAGAEVGAGDGKRSVA